MPRASRVRKAMRPQRRLLPARRHRRTSQRSHRTVAFVPLWLTSTSGSRPSDQSPRRHPCVPDETSLLPLPAGGRALTGVKGGSPMAVTSCALSPNNSCCACAPSSRPDAFTGFVMRAYSPHTLAVASRSPAAASTTNPPAVNPQTTTLHPPPVPPPNPRHRTPTPPTIPLANAVWIGPPFSKEPSDLTPCNAPPATLA